MASGGGINRPRGVVGEVHGDARRCRGKRMDGGEPGPTTCFGSRNMDRRRGWGPSLPLPDEVMRALLSFLLPLLPFSWPFGGKKGILLQWWFLHFSLEYSICKLSCLSAIIISQSYYMRAIILEGKRKSCININGRNVGKRWPFTVGSQSAPWLKK